MCVALPLKIIEIDGKTALCDSNGVKANVRIDFIPDAKIGDHVMVHAGFAIEKIKPENVESELELFNTLTGLT
ncbi:MAG: HypC/HybG/HupF family hydrogenase formation chaperone [Lachnospiraceae bacterium]|nr:HypC/HybG/HupF family hydrogenase formation chaperone [Lachnospiraceae bacterium]